MGVSEELILHETYKKWDIIYQITIKKPRNTSQRLSSIEILFAMTPCDFILG